LGGKLHLRLNIGERPIANKDRVVKIKRTLKRELKVPEIAKREANEPSHFVGGTPLSGYSPLDPCRKRGEVWSLCLGFLMCLLQVSPSIPLA